MKKEKINGEEEGAELIQRAGVCPINKDLSF
jgi:hypothetical protein